MSTDINSINTKESFIDFILTVLVRRKVDAKNLPDVNFYVNEIYNKNFHRGFCKAIIQYTNLLSKENTLAFAKHYPRCADIITTATFNDRELEHKLTFPPDTLKFLRTLIYKIGVYRFNKDGIPSYIGSSKNIYYRVVDSVARYGASDNLTFQHLTTSDRAKAFEVEKYYIQYLKPTENRQFRTKEKIRKDNSMPTFCEPRSIEQTSFMKGILSSWTL